MDFSKTSFKDIYKLRLNKVQVSELEKIVSNSKELFNELVSIIVKGTQHEAFMASWVLQYAGVKQPEWFYEYLETLLKHLEINPNESVLRCVTRVIWKTKIPSEMDGIVTQKCFEWLEKKENPIAVKAFSIHILSKIIDHEPELCHEIKDLTESVLPYVSSGLANSAEKLLKKIKKMGY